MIQEFSIMIMNTENNSYWEERNILLKDLYLWDENARFPDKYFNKSEKDLIKYFCSKKNFKIESLAKEIAKDFDMPQLEKLVIYEIDERMIVLEGNRRLTAYKLLNDPELAPNERLKVKFQRLKDTIDIDENYLFDCLITKNKTEGFRYIERKHVNGNNEVGWGDQERANHNVRRGNATKKEEFKVAIAKIIKGLDIPEEFKDKVLGHGYVTNFWRILESSVAWKEYGFNLKENGELEIEDESFEEKLKVIILNVLKKEDFSGRKIDSRSLNTNKEKKEYLKSITSEDSKKVDKEIEDHTTIDLFGEEGTTMPTPSTKKQRANPKSTARKYLIPKTCILVIDEAKINNIYHELRSNLLLDDSKNAVPNAVGVLFRVFLEISLDFYAKKNQHGFKKNDTISQKIPWVVDDLIKKGFDKKDFHHIRKVASAKGHMSYLSIDNFHEYVHSYTTQPTSSELKTKWDILQKFFEILWSSLQKK